MNAGVRRVVAAAAWALVAAGAAGLAVRWTTRDAWHPLAVVFYATPAPLVVLSGALGCALAAALRRRALALAGAAVGACALATVLTCEIRVAHAAPQAARPALTGLLWNTAHGTGGWDDKLEFARALDPDLMVFVESPGRTDPVRAQFEAAFPQHASAALPGNMMVLARGTTVRRSLRRLSSHGGRAAAVDVGIAGRAFRVVAVDIPAKPWLNRGPLIAEALAFGRSGDAARTLVLGDFNTPRDSAFFDAWRPAFRHGWDAAGAGYDATWPMPVPVLAIDQVWAGSGIRVVSYGPGGAWASDHRPVVFTFDVE